MIHRRTCVCAVLATTVLAAMALAVCMLLRQEEGTPTPDDGARPTSAAAGMLETHASSVTRQPVATHAAPGEAPWSTTVVYALRWQRESRVCALADQSDLLPQVRIETFSATLWLRLCDRRDDELLWTARLQHGDADAEGVAVHLRTRADGTWLGVASDDTDAASDGLAILRCVPLATAGEPQWRTRQAFPIGTAEVDWSATQGTAGERGIQRRYGRWQPRSPRPLRIDASGGACAGWRSGAPDDPFFAWVTVDESLHVEHPHLGIAVDHRIVGSLERDDRGADEALPRAGWNEVWRELLPSEIERPWRAELLPIPLAAVLDAAACAWQRGDPLDPRLGQVARLLPELLWHVPGLVEQATTRLLQAPVDLAVTDLLARALTRVGDDSCQRALMPVLERGASAVRQAVIVCSDELSTPSPAWIACLRAIAHRDIARGEVADEATVAAWLALAALARRSGPQQTAVAESAWAALAPTVPLPAEHVAAWLDALAASGRPEAAALAAPYASSPDPAIRGAAVAALGACAGSTHLALLRRLAVHDPAPGVRRRAGNALAWLGEPDAGTEVDAAIAAQATTR